MTNMLEPVIFLMVAWCIHQGMRRIPTAAGVGLAAALTLVITLSSRAAIFWGVHAGVLIGVAWLDVIHFGLHRKIKMSGKSFLKRLILVAGTVATLDGLRDGSK